MYFLSRNSGFYRILIWIAVLLCIFVLLSLIERLDAKNIPFDDYPEYWAAGRLLSQGSNPYSVEEVVKIRNEVGQVAELSDDAAVFLYPPWALPLVLPFGLLPYLYSRILWLLLNIALLIGSVERIWRMYSGQPSQRWRAWLLVVTFFPTILVLAAGHANPLFLFSFTLFILVADKDKPTRITDLIAGVCITLLTVKFHLHYLFLIAALHWILNNRRWFVLAGAILSVAGLTLISTACNPQILYHYFHLLKSYPFHAWASPTVGSVLRYGLGVEIFWLQFLPPIIGTAWYLTFWMKERQEWRWLDQMPLLLLVSVFTAAYGWTGDYVILLIPILQSLASLVKHWDLVAGKAFIVSFLGLSLLAFIFHSRLMNVSDFWLFWFSPAILVWFLMVQKSMSRVEMNLRFASS